MFRPRAADARALHPARASIPSHEMQFEFERNIETIRTQIEKLKRDSKQRGQDSSRIEEMETRLTQVTNETYRNLSPMEQVQVARHPRRPYTLDYVERIFTDWIELHGDRNFRDDEAIVGGWARLGDRSLMVIGHQKGRDMKENLRRNFGMPHPEGYRKALRLMRQAEKFGRPVVTFIDTPGAFPGIGSEERGIAESIARNLREMACLKVPTISVVIGEGMSGGALGIGVTDRIVMLQHSIYSVISPEGCAAILWRTAEKKEEAAVALRLTAKDLVEMGVCDKIVPEPDAGAHSDWDAAAKSLSSALGSLLDELAALTTDALIAERHAKYEAVGAWQEANA